MLKSMIIKFLKKILPREAYKPSLIKILSPEIHEQLVAVKQENRHAATSEINCHILMKIIAENENIKNTLEIGFAKGVSAASIIYAKRKFLSNQNVHLAIDPFFDDVWKSEGIHLIDKLGYSAHLKVIKDTSDQVLPKLIDDSVHLDLIYIDGSHNFDIAFVDFYYSSKLLSESGFLVFDDLTRQEIRKIRKYIKKNKSNEFKEVKIYDLLNDPQIPFLFKLYNLIRPNIYVLVKNKNNESVKYTYSNF